MKIVFFGTPDYVLPILVSLHKEFRIKGIPPHQYIGGGGKSPVVAVVTQSPKPIGRKKFMHYSPVDTWAYKRKIPVFFDSRELIKSKIEADMGILAAYGSIIPKEVIVYFPKGILNIHPSLLPSWRGASPVQATLVAGEKITGITIIKLDEELDHGPIISQFKEEVLEDDTTDSLRRRLFERSAEVIKTLLPAYLKGKITPRPQEHDKATFTTLLKKDHAFIPPEYLDACLRGRSLQADWEIPFMKDYSLVPSAHAKGTSSAYTLDCFIRAMQPWPVAWTFVKLSSKLKASAKGGSASGGQSSKRLKILKAHLAPSSINPSGPEALKGRGHQTLVIDEVQLEGKNPVSWKQFKEAYPETRFES